MESIVTLKLIRNKKKKTPPNCINNDFSRRKRPGLFGTKKNPPFDFSGWRCGIALDVLPFADRTIGMVFWFSVENQPQNQPRETKSACEQKCQLPSQMHRDPRHDQWSNNRPNVRPRVENPRCQRPLFLRKPFRNALDARREDSCLAEPQSSSRDHKGSERMREGMPHRRDAPKDHRSGVANACA